MRSKRGDRIARGRIASNRCRKCCLIERQPISVIDRLFFLCGVFSHRSGFYRNTLYYAVLLHFPAVAVDLRLALQTGVRQAEHSDDACGGEAQCKGANPAGLERAELGDMAHGCHRSRNQPFAGGRQQQSQMECAVSAAEQEAVRHMYGDFRQKSRGSQKRQREEEDDERGNQPGVDPLPHVDR